jgi:ABC-2 type transport system ATP-binding protein
MADRSPAPTIDTRLSDPVVLAEHLAVRRGRRLVIDEVSFAVDVGVTALLGPNGAGKTTLLEALATILPVDRGRLMMCGVELGSNRARRAILRRSGFMPQDFRPITSFTVADFVAYAAWTKQVADHDLDRSIARSLDIVQLSDHANARIRSLSGGMRQRLGIACALVHQPRLLLLDEPTVGLDPEQRHIFRSIVRRVGEQSAVLLSTHLTDDVEAMCDRVLVINQGTIRFDGSTAELVRLGAAVPGGVGGRDDRTTVDVTAGSIERGYFTALTCRPESTPGRTDNSHGARP